MACNTILPVPVDCPITIYIGSTFGPFRIYLTDEATGDPFPILGYVPRAEVRPVAQYPTQYFDLLPVVTDASIGLITIEVPQDVTGTLVPMDAVWDLILISSGGKRLGPFVGGSVTIKNAVSRTP